MSLELTHESFDEQVIYDVVLSDGRKLRGYFREDHGVPGGMISLTIYDGGDVTQPERWIYLNPAHIVSVQIWFD